MSKLIALLDNYKYEQKPRLWRCSSLGQCKRKHFWSRKDEPKDDDHIENLDAFDVGNAIHKHYQEKLAKLGVLAAHELYMESGTLSGHSDGLLWLDGQLVILDIKSTAKNLTEGTKKDGSAKKCLIEPDTHHVAQVYGYQKLYWDMGIMPKLGKILYISKDNRRGVEKREFDIELTPETYIKVAKEIAELDMYWKAKKLPDPLPVEDWECDYCPYNKKCHANQCLLDSKK